MLAGACQLAASQGVLAQDTDKTLVAVDPGADKAMDPDASNGKTAIADENFDERAVEQAVNSGALLPGSKEPEANVIPEDACELRVYTVSRVHGLTKSSGLAKFIANVALPVAGAFVPVGAFTAGALAKGGATGIAQGIAVDRASDVPPAVANVFTPTYQFDTIQSAITNAPNLSNSAPIVEKDRGYSPYKYYRDELVDTGKTCLRVFNIQNVTLEHSKDYSKRNAITVAGYFSQFSPDKKNAIIDAPIDASVPLVTSPLAEGEDQATLQAEIRSAYEAAITKAVQEFSAEHARKFGI